MTLGFKKVTNSIFLDESCMCNPPLNPDLKPFWYFIMEKERCRVQVDWQELQVFLALIVLWQVLMMSDSHAKNSKDVWTKIQPDRGHSVLKMRKANSQVNGRQGSKPGNLSKSANVIKSHWRWIQNSSKFQKPRQNTWNAGMKAQYWEHSGFNTHVRWH